MGRGWGLAFVALLVGCSSLGGPGPAGRVTWGTMVTWDGSLLTVDTADGRVSVPLGSSVTLWKASSVPGGPLAVGQWVTVDGHPSDGGWVATRVLAFDRAPGSLGPTSGRPEGVLRSVTGESLGIQGASDPGALRTVTLAPDTLVSHPVPAKAPDLHPGVQVWVEGQEVVIVSPPVDPKKEALRGVVHAQTTARDHPLTWQARTLETSDDDEGALLAVGSAMVTLDKVRISTTGNSTNPSGDHSGLAASLVAQGGGRIHLTYGEILTTGSGASGVVASGPGSSAVLERVKVGVLGDWARGVAALGGGDLVLKDTDVVTRGARGPGIVAETGSTVTLEGGRLVTSGSGSPGVWASGVVTLTGTLGTALGAEAIVVDGGRVTQVAGGWKTSGPGPGIRVTSAGGTVTWDHCDLASGVVVASEGAAQVTLKAAHLTGDLALGPGASVAWVLTDGSTWVGAVRSPPGNPGASVTLDGSSGWQVTQDSHIETYGGPTDGTTVPGLSGDATVTYDPVANPGLGGLSYRFARGLGRLVPQGSTHP